MKQWRAALVLVGCGGFLLVAPRWAPQLPAGAWSQWWAWVSADPQRALASAAGLAAWLVTAWLFVIAALALLAASVRRSRQGVLRIADAVTPRAARGLVKALLGAAVAVAGAGPAVAAAPPAPISSSQPDLAPVPAPVVAPPERAPLPDLDRPGLPSPRAVSPPPPALRLPAAPQLPPAPQPRPTQIHVVQPGDTLWALAAQRLPAASSPAEITRGWQRWYEANHAAIGPDPGLLLVGERLAIPEEPS